MSILHSQLGLSPRSMFVLLLTANVVVVAIYLLSTLAVMSTLWPALCDLGRLVFKLNAAVKALLRLFERVFGHPATRIAAHGVVYAKSLYAVAAGSIVAPAAPLAGVLLAVLGHLSATILVNANQKARFTVCSVDTPGSVGIASLCACQALPSGRFDSSLPVNPPSPMFACMSPPCATHQPWHDRTSSAGTKSAPVARTRPTLFFALAMASSAVCHQNLLVGAVAVAAVLYAAAAWCAALKCTSERVWLP